MNFHNFLTKNAWLYIKNLALKMGIVVTRNSTLAQIKELAYSEHYKDYTFRLQERILEQSTGVIHIGAHIGQEREIYFKFGVKVIWVEADPEIHKQLVDNIKTYVNQEAICALIGQDQLESRKFYISSNSGKSSSVFELGADVIHPNLSMVNTRTLPTETIFSLFSKRDLSDYNYWVFDIQGAELEALKGAQDLINICFIIKIEVSNREEYKGGANFEQVKNFLATKGFIPLWLPAKNGHEDLIFVRTKPVW